MKRDPKDDHWEFTAIGDTVYITMEMHMSLSMANKLLEIVERTTKPREMREEEL